MPSTHDNTPPSPPRAPTVKYEAPHGTRWDKEKAAAGGAHAFDLPSDPKALGPWIIGECVGKGASGRVKIAKHRYTNQLAAVKILPRAPLDSSRNSIATQEAKFKKHSLGIEREITMMKLMNHPNILRIYDVYESSKELFLILEFVEGGELFDYLVNRGRLPEPDAICFFKQIIYGLNYAHTFSIIHRDLKPENILISSLSPPKIKIVDWGMAAFAPPSLQLETSCGSPHYASPEIVNGYKYTGNATDIWSCGVILYALLTGRLPFDDKDVKVLLGKVKVGKYEMPSFIDRSAQDLISRMLVIDAHERITIPEILVHPWLNTSPAALRHLSVTSEPSAGAILPPSPSTLSRPIADPSSIDPDILFSLKVIWGRHADPDAILKDLASPAGNGVHTKAFYWLLRRHHEEAEKLASSEELKDDDSICNGMGQGSVTFNLDWELDTSGLGGPAVKTCMTRRGMELDRGGSTRLLPPLMVRNTTSSTVTSSSRGRPSSPGGPRLPYVPRPTYERNSYIVSNRSASSDRNSSRTDSSLAVNNSGDSGIRMGSVVNGGHGGPRPQPPKRGHTYSHPRSEKQSSHTTAPTHTASSRSSSSSGTAVSVVQFSPTHVVQYTQNHRSTSRPSRARSATSAAVTLGEEQQQHRPHSQTRVSGTRTCAGELSLQRANSGTSSSNKSSTACSITSTVTVHAPIPRRAVSGGYGVSMHVADNSSDAIPSSTSPPPLLPPLAPLQPLPLLTAPKTNDPVLQSELEVLANHVNRLSAAEMNQGARDLQAPLKESKESHSQQHQKRPQATRQTSYQQQRFQSPKSTRRRAISTAERGLKGHGTHKENKENTGADESWSYVAVPTVELPNAGAGKNAVFANTGNVRHANGVNEDGKGKKKEEKEKKPRPPPLEFPPLNRKRSTISSTLGSPIALSPPMNSMSTKALGSPVVGEFKGWLSNLFSWPGKNSSGNGILYSTDDVVKTRRDLLNLLVSLGVVVEAYSAEPGIERDSSPLRCRVEDSPVSDGIAHLGMKPVKFRIEISAIGEDGLIPSSPMLPPNARGRSSTLGGGAKSPHLSLSPLPSPNFLATPGHGFSSVLIVIQEKGSMSTFKAIWKRLKEVYDDGLENSYSSFSPLITSTPVMEPSRVAV